MIAQLEEANGLKKKREVKRNVVKTFRIDVIIITSTTIITKKQKLCISHDYPFSWFSRQVTVVISVFDAIQR